MNKKLILSLMLGIFLIGIISAQVSYCCERLINNGPWCQNANATECETGYNCGEDINGDPIRCLSVPTSCEATSYCRLGVCINSGEGTCLQNTPQRVCESNGGTWDDREKEDIPQCQLGCCLIGEQAAFTTLTRCKSLASLYGLNIDYRTDVTNEASCILMATSKVKGACVFEEEYQRNCKITTRTECSDMAVGDSSTDFYEGYLCSAEQLETICAPRGGTTCVDGKDEVYFLDSCGNIANVYDASRTNDALYWEKIMAPTCDLETDGANSCGACDYYDGSTCKRAERGENPNYGNYICRDLGCEDTDFRSAYGRNPEHGETWCADAGGIGGSRPGSRHFRMVCYNGEVSVEPCADFRQEICIETSIGSVPSGGFKTANCIVNKWQDCYSQANEKDCENFNERDCEWNEATDYTDAICVPFSAPGFNFWEEGTDASEICSIGSATCYVEYEGYLWDQISGERGKAKWDWKCVDDCRANDRDACPQGDDPLGICKATCQKKCPVKCVDEEGNIKEEWLENMNDVCSSLGDCGIEDNYDGQEGYYEPEDLWARSGIEEEE